MSFYFQPPIFAVCPTMPPRPPLMQMNTVVPTYTILQPVLQPVVYTPSPTPAALVYTIPTKVSLHDAQAACSARSHLPSPRLVIQIIYYGHDRVSVDGEGDAAGGRIWCRAVDASYGEAPTKARLAEDISRLAPRAGVRTSAWRQSTMFIMYPGSGGVKISPGVGPVVNEDVLRVLELWNPRARGSGDEEDVTQREWDGVLGRLAKGQVVLCVMVCMDEERHGHGHGLGGGCRESSGAGGESVNGHGTVGERVDAGDAVDAVDAVDAGGQEENAVEASEAAASTC